MGASVSFLATITRGRLSPAEKAAIEALAERRFTVGRIAMKLNRHPSTVANELIRIGARGPIAYRTASYRRGNSIVRPFTSDEDAFIEALRVQDFTWAKIGELCGKRFGHPRRAATIGIRLRQLAARERVK